MADKYSNIVYVYQENQGAGASRNTGIDKSKGSYIAFVDADDYLEKDYLRVLYSNIRKYDADIACCDSIEVIDGIPSDGFHCVLDNRIVNNVDEYISDYREKKEYYGSVVWAKLFKKEFLANKRFENV